MDLMHKARRNILSAEAKSHATFNKNQTSQVFNPGDLVLLDSSYMVLDQDSAKKLEDKFFGPFRIIEKVKTSYRLDLPEDMRGVYPVFHKMFLRKYKGAHDAVTEVQGDIEKIIGHKNVRGEVNYFVKLTTLPITNLVYRSSDQVPANLREKYWKMK